MSSLTAEEVAPLEAFRLPNHSVEEPEAGVEPQEVLGEDGLPLLKTFLAEDETSRAEAMHIVADSVAQQRNIGSRALIFHPVSFLILAVSLAFLKKLYTEDGGTTNWIMVGTTGLGVIMSLLGATRLTLGPYIFEAERVGTWAWLKQGRSSEDEAENGYKVLENDDEILVTKFGHDYIGAIIFRGVELISSAAPSTTGKRSRRPQSPSKRTKMIIRAWSVSQKYRRKEVGSALMDDAIKLGMSRGWTTDGVEIAEDHANHKRVLPSMFNGALDQYSRIAQKTLDKKIEELGLGLERNKRRK